jgi:hypothetical protein
MALVFDSLGFAKRLREAGVLGGTTAEAHAEAVRDIIMLDLVTKADLEAALERLTLSLTIRLGGMIAVGIGILAAVGRMH